VVSVAVAPAVVSVLLELPPQEAKNILVNATANTTLAHDGKWMSVMTISSLNKQCSIKSSEHYLFQRTRS
jgi:hypothetical protein